MRGGGGGAGSSATLAPFVKFSSIAVPGTVRIGGASQQADYTYDNNSNRVTSLSAATPFTSGASYVGNIDANGDTTKAVFTSATGTSITVDTANGGRFLNEGNFSAGVTANDQDFVLSAVPRAFGWDYQTFGVWTTGQGTASGTAGVTTIGAETAGLDIPRTGTGTFMGVSGGAYVDSTGSNTLVSSEMTATANFGTRSIAFATTNTRDFFSNANMSVLNTTGTLNYDAGVNQFTGAVSTVGGGDARGTTAVVPMTGSATGKFYGPTAQEIGGTFAVSGGGTTGYLGAFGGKR